MWQLFVPSYRGSLSPVSLILRYGYRDNMCPSHEVRSTTPGDEV